MRKKAGPVIAALLLIVVIGLILVIGKKIENYIPSEEVQDLEEYFGIEEPDDVAIIRDQELTELKGKCMDGKIYLDFDIVHDEFNSRFYWDQNEQLLRYTTAEDLVTAYAGRKEYFVGNDVTREDYEIVKLRDDTVYVALDFVKKYTDLGYELYTDPYRIMLTTVWKGLCGTTTVSRDTELRVKGGIKSPILTELEKGTEVIVLESMEEWCKVSTVDGLIGYVKNKKLTGEGKQAEFSEAQLPPHSYEGETFTHNLMEEPVNLLWHQTMNADANARIATVLANSKNVNVISPTWFYLNDNEGNLSDAGSKDYVNYCHEQGVKVWGLVSNLENSEVDSTYVLTHTSVRENLVNQIIAKALNYNLDGINIDFEALSGDVGDGFIQFIRELSLKCDDNGLVLSVDNYVPSAYTQFYNRAEQANFADYVIVMAYDEHYSGTDEGSVASIGFVREGAQNTLAQGVPAEQLILGMPFYTRIWAETPKEEDGDSAEAASDDYVGYELSCETASMAEARSRIDVNGAQITWLEDCGQNYAQYEADGITYKIWLEDARSLDVKLQVMKDLKLAGAAFWKAGMETADVWDTISSYLE
ncbi:MAG: glycosyl hydrolase family 18 protein [bacterium]|nr:glycosyl hydrolase family 18 protein [bacterium]MDY4100098.1 glycosyl hydrolase family 18 protein [Lachnospiraceae bacterium]